MRLFSNGKGKKCISTFIINEDRHIKHASISNMACEDNFIQEKKVDNALTRMENITAPILREIINTKQMPEIGSENHHRLLNYIMLQRNRTLKTVTEQSRRLDEMVPIIAKAENVPISVVRESCEQSNLYSPEFSIQIARDKGIVLVDLEMALLYSSHKDSFITSDNPVVFYNQHFQDPLHRSDYVGVNTRGLIIQLPLNSKMLIMLYDHSTYTMRKARKQKMCFISRLDIKKINMLQACNANYNIFADELVKESELRKLIRVVSSDRKRMANHPYVFVARPGETFISSLPEDPTKMVTSPPLIKGICFDFFEHSQALRHEDLPPQYSYIRDSENVALYKQFNNYKERTRNVRADFHKWYYSVYRVDRDLS